ncbi:transglutaminase-like cysteine peptidase [Idiomarina aminovorans]|uniref:transglutaminase-like cysteine peptidase n=1 Tax=Idiomarina aminovorans TaxID=2914829 RepID=UPI00200483E4|nr:transglutaminase-like cysteine peptidase [Idiomarina sp. ATCH4]MCK7460344.1 transglutaminase-like cysteine peptidase [Idiomarina sp. ATCH4]
MKQTYLWFIICLVFIPLWLKAGDSWQIDKKSFSQAISTYQPNNSDRIAQQWFRLLAELTDDLNADNKTKEVRVIKKMNRFIHNNVSYKTDSVLYDTPDYWASVAQTLGQGFGDCEDFAIAQYSTLRSLGIPDEKLRLIYVKAQIGNAYRSKTQAHMVLGYYSSPDAEPLIIDSLIEKVLPASKRNDLTPVFSFNSAGLWAGSSERRAKSNPLDRLSRWRDVLSRLEQEGISWRNN